MAEPSRSSSFQWGEKVRDSLTSYEFMHYKGTRYDLHDCVLVRSYDESQPWVGKLMRLYQERDGIRKVRIRWFMRLGELPLSVRKNGKKVEEKEVYIAQGGLKGVENENVVEVILRKAIVLCCWNSPRNPKPSPEQLKRADYFFKLAYDVSSKKLKTIPELDRTLVLKLINKPEWVRSVAVEELPAESGTRKKKSPDSMEDSKKRCRVGFSPLEPLEV